MCLINLRQAKHVPFSPQLECRSFVDILMLFFIHDINSLRYFTIFTFKARRSCYKFSAHSGHSVFGCSRLRLDKVGTSSNDFSCANCILRSPVIELKSSFFVILNLDFRVLLCDLFFDDMNFSTVITKIPLTCLEIGKRDNCVFEAISNRAFEYLPNTFSFFLCTFLL